MVEPVTGGTGPEGQGGVRDGGAGDRAGPSTPPAPDRRVPWLVALLGLAFLGLYLATFTRWYTFDSVAYAENIRTYRASGELRWLFHPHHLLFNVMGLLFQEALQPFHPAITSLTALQVFTAVMGALGVVAFALWAYESLGSAPSALIGAAALGVSYGWWFASTDGRANIASAAMLLVVLWALGRAERNGGGRWTVAAGAFLGLTCLLHESHVFFLPVALVSIAVWSVPRRDRWRNALSFALAFGLSVAVPYLFAIFGALGYRSRTEILDWVLAYGKQGTWWSFHPLANLPADGTALYKVFTGQDAYLLNGHHPEFGGAWGVAAIACWAVLVLAVVRGVRMGGWRLSRPSTLALVLTFSLYSAFFTIWTPGYFVFWLTQGAMIMGLGAAGSPETFRDIRWRRAAIIAVAVLGLVTYTDAIRPKTVAATNRHLRMAEHLRPLGSPANLMVLSGMGWMAEDEVYVPYFAHLPVIALHAQWDRAGRDPALATEAIRGYINATLAAGGHAYLLGEAVDSPYSLLDMRERYGVTPETIRGVFSPYHMVPVDRYDNVTIYELRLKRKTTTTQTVNDLR